MESRLKFKIGELIVLLINKEKLELKFYFFWQTVILF